MNLELGVLHKDIDNKELLLSLDAAIRCKCAAIVCFPTHLPYLYSFWRDANSVIKLFSVVDYPNGSSVSPVRLHEILAIEKLGAHGVDLTINTSAIKQQNFNLVSKDTQTAKNVCADHGLIFRVIIEYRLLTNQEIIDVVEILNQVGVDFLINSTGSIVDDTLDNLLNCQSLISQFSGGVIANGRILTKQHYQMFLGHCLHGVRFNSWQNLNRIHDLNHTKKRI